jgi:hypothetical protein
VQQALRLLDLADHLEDLAGVPGVHVQAGGEEVADGALAQGAEQSRFPGVTAADATDMDLGHLLHGYLSLVALFRDRGGGVTGTWSADARDREDRPALAPSILAREGVRDGAGLATRGVGALHADRSGGGPPFPESVVCRAQESAGRDWRFSWEPVMVASETAWSGETVSDGGDLRGYGTACGTQLPRGRPRLSGD